MTKLMSFPQHLRATLALGLPLIGSHLAQMALHVIDTLLLGRYGVAELAAAVLGTSAFFIMFMLGSGFAQAVMPMVATALGRGDETQVRRSTRMGLWLSILFGALSYPVFWVSGGLFLRLGQEPEIAALAQDFLRIAGLGMIPALLVMVLKSYLAALERTQVVLWTTVAAAVLNLVIGWTLIFGHGPAPKLGIRGAAIASVVVQVVSALVLALYAAGQPALRRFHLFQRFWRADWDAMAQVFRLGLPIGLTAVAEGGLFSATAVMMGWIGKAELAAHGIALEITALAFMIHVGLANAATIRIGRAEGEGDARRLRDAARATIVLSLGIALAVIALFLALPGPIMRLFLDPGAEDLDRIVAFGTVLLALAALFQVADAMQVVALGLLRGVQDTRAPMVIAVVSYWMVGIPAAYVLAFPFGLGGAGLWLGLVVGLALTATLLMRRFWKGRARAEASGQTVLG